jgi:DNA-binding NarL/FixJ family response regulator
MKEIGKELDLSSKTVETYKARGSSKLNLTGRRQIVEFAIARGWVDSTRLTAG